MTEIAALQNQNSPPTMPFATEFLVVFRHTLYSHLWKKKTTYSRSKFYQTKRAYPFLQQSQKTHNSFFYFVCTMPFCQFNRLLNCLQPVKPILLLWWPALQNITTTLKKKPNENKTKNPNTSKVRWFCYDFAQFHKKIVLQLGPWEITGSSRQEQNAEKMFLLCPAALNCYINHSNKRIRTQLPEKHRNFRNMWCSKFIIVADLFSISTWM